VGFPIFPGPRVRPLVAVFATVLGDPWAGSFPIDIVALAEGTGEDLSLLVNDAPLAAVSPLGPIPFVDGVSLLDEDASTLSQLGDRINLTEIGTGLSEGRDGA
jgi:hypothetical protein